MGFGSSLLLIAVGAILRFAITVNTHGINLQTVGVILMVVGVVGFLISLFWMAVWAECRNGNGPNSSSDPNPTVRQAGPRY